MELLELATRIKEYPTITASALPSRMIGPMRFMIGRAS